MKNIFKIFIALFILSLNIHAYDINDKTIYQKDFENNTIYLPLNNYRTLIFNKRIKNIQLTNSENISAEFIDSNKKPLQILKILGKKIGSESAIVTLENDKSVQINFSIMQNLDSIISIVKSTYPNLIIEQANDTIILKGYVKNYKEKDLVINIFKAAGIKTDDKLVDIVQTKQPSKMIRIKMYAVEINKSDGLKLKNNWAMSSKNYQTYTFYDSVNDREYTRNVPLGYVEDSSVRDQYSESLETTLDGIMTNAVGLTGGLTGIANYLGKYFNTSLTLQYIASEGVANILDETTLITLENKNAKFLAGGTIRFKTQSSTAEGLPTSGVEVIQYGLLLEFKAKNIMNDEFIDLEITTTNSEPDFTNTVEGIPSIKERTINTNVLARNGSTIILGGLVKNENSYDEDKIPLLGDIPILGFLFKSKDFTEGKSELVFFITPEVVDPAQNNQDALFKKTQKDMLDTSKYKDKDSIFEKFDESKVDINNEYKKKEKVEQKKESTPKTNIFKSSEPKMTEEEAHQKRVNEILGY